MDDFDAMSDDELYAELPELRDMTADELNAILATTNRHDLGYMSGWSPERWERVRAMHEPRATVCSPEYSEADLEWLAKVVAATARMTELIEVWCRPDLTPKERRAVGRAVDVAQAEHRAVHGLESVLPPDVMRTADPDESVH